MKYKEIVAIATSLKVYVEKNKKFPSSLKVDGKEYKYCKMADIFAKSILNLGEDITESNCRVADNPTGSPINEKIFSSDYRDQAKRIVQFIKQNGKCPNYVVSVKSKTKIRPSDFIYAFAKIIVWYHKNKAKPSYCLYDSSVYSQSSSLRKYGRSTQNGCDNRGQNNGYFCACHMAQEIVRNLTGIVIPQSKIASIMGTTTSGTGHDGINTFFAWFNRNYSQYELFWEWKNFSDVGWTGMKKILESSNQDCGLHELYRDTWGHYTNFDKVYSDSVDVHNSLGSVCSGSCYCGYTENRSKSEAQRYLNGISQKSVFVVTRKR